MNAPCRRGRPPKFGRPSQPVTLTLPDDVVAAFRAVDPDLSRAIVRVAETAGPVMAARPDVELARFARSAVIVVKPNRVVARLPGVVLVPLPDGRALISLDDDTSIAEFDVHVRDALDLGTVSPADRPTLEQLAGVLRSARLARGVNLSQRNIIVLETAPKGRRHTRGRRKTLRS